MAQWSPTPLELADLEVYLLGAWPEDHPFSVDLGDNEPAEPVDLVDPEGTPLATYDPRDHSVTPRTQPEYGLFRRYQRTVDQVRSSHPHQRSVVVREPLTLSDVAELGREPTVLLVAMGPGGPQGLSPATLFRATRVATQGLDQVTVVPLPLRDQDQQFHAAVARAYGDNVITLPHDGPVADAVQELIVADHVSAADRGLVIFFTGLSGSGKSTLARGLRDQLLEQGLKVTSLDGDVIRQVLASELGFSPEDRDKNIRRIGWVAAEIARHGGTVICSPIAPFDSTRREVRAMVEDAGANFALIHVSTPIEECESRDRKGLYAKARAGLIADFTGISSPYEVPADAILRLNTAGLDVSACVEQVVEALTTAGVWHR